MASLVASSLDSAQASLDALYHLHDHTFSVGKKTKANRMNELISEIETHLVAAGFATQLRIRSATDKAAANADALEAGPTAATAADPAVEPAKAPAETNIPAASLTKKEKVRAFFIYGKALDAMEGYNENAEKYLSKSVKLSPADVDAWNALANCFWKKGDLIQAQQCFQSALEQRENAHSLREMSILRRQLGGSNTEMVDNMVQSLKEAKKAIALDVTDKKSWYVLGNAHLAQFFQLQHDPADLSKALKAYRRAMPAEGKNEIVETAGESAGGGHAAASASAAETNPDLFFNRATVHKYLENYDQAIADFKAAAALDPELPAANMITYIERSCAKIQKHVESRCRVKAKRLSSISGSILGSQQHKVVLQSMQQQNRAQKEATQKENTQKENSTTSGAQAKAATQAIEMTTVSSLAVGKNQGKVVALKLLMPVVHETHDPPAYVDFYFGSHLPCFVL
jgi:tetratricopeptide (TPR) repeat protein